ncbi:MAG: YggS family pyridoxal phosphate-dependent enzyme [Armatimonadetes bacterium]|nr:YggS family pyridoxal phosphate-dependent enzyme [Armatimonadota bacterium]
MGIAERLQEIQSRIDKACESANRAPQQITLIAVSKTFPTEAIQEAYDCGHRHFGESRLQELLPKAEALPKDIFWHFIGKIQSNKIRRAAGICSLIHTLESHSQIQELEKLDKPTDVLIEINIAREEKKSGILPEDLDKFYQRVLISPTVRYRGLMTIGSNTGTIEQTKAEFRTMRELSRKYEGDFLSMGMSGDFEVALQEGATHIRVGTAIFGGR